MYKITIQTLTGKETTIYYPGDPEYTVSSAVITYEIGLAGEFNFAIPVTNPAYDLIVRNSIITVYENDKEIWRGDIRNIKTNFDKSLSVYVVEDLAWLGEEPAAMVAVTNQTYAQRFNAVMSAYNSNQAIKRQFQAGQLTAQTSSSTCFWEPEYGDSVLSDLRKFIAKDNGYLKVRRVYESNTKGLTITFDSRTETEESYDYLEIYYKLSNKWYKRTLTGEIGAVSVYVPTPIFYLRWHSDVSHHNYWGWKINSIEITDSGTPEDFSQSNLPYAFWVEIYSPENIPESTHYYSDNEDKYYKFMLWQNTVVRYIDIVTLSDYGKQSTQRVEFGSNMINFLKDMDVTNLCNALYPYGAETETELYNEVMQRIAGTPIQNNDSIAVYGRRAKTVVFDTDSTTVLNNLASSYLSRYSQPSLTFEIQAADLNGVENVDAFAIGDSVRVVASVYAIDQWIYITQLGVNLLDKSQNQIKLSDVVRSVSLTSQVATQIDEIRNEPIPMSILDAAKKNAFAILEGDNGGIVTLRKNDDDQIIELVIANNMDLTQATKAWRWNLNGLAYLHRTYPSDNWTVGIAATMDGGFVADFITTGTLNAQIVDVVNLNASNIKTGSMAATRIKSGTMQANRISGGSYVVGGVDNSEGVIASVESITWDSTWSSMMIGSWVSFYAGTVYQAFWFRVESTGKVEGDLVGQYKIGNGDWQDLLVGDNLVGTFNVLTEVQIKATYADISYTTGLARVKTYIDNDGVVADNLVARNTGYIGDLILASGELYKTGNLVIFGAKQYHITSKSSATYKNIQYFRPYKLDVYDSTFTLSIEYTVSATVNRTVYLYLEKYVSGSWQTLEGIYLQADEGTYTDAFNTVISKSDRSRYRLQISYIDHSWDHYITITVFAPNTRVISISPQSIWGAHRGSFVGTGSFGTASCDYFHVGEIYVEDDGDDDIRITNTEITKNYGTNTYTVQWQSSSDERIKENIEPLDIDLSRGFIDATRTKRFKYKGADGIHYGMIAQEARELLDNLGESDAVLEFSQGDLNVEDQRAIQYDEYIPHLINYVKDLRAELVALKEEVRLLKEEKVNG